MIPCLKNSQAARRSSRLVRCTWKTSQAEISGKPCQACHMPEARRRISEWRKNSEKSRIIVFPEDSGKFVRKRSNLMFQRRSKRKTSQVDVTIKSSRALTISPCPIRGGPDWWSIFPFMGKNLRRPSITNNDFISGVLGGEDGKETVFDFEANNVLQDTLLKPEEVTQRIVYLPHTKRCAFHGCVCHAHLCPRSWADKTFLKKIEK